MYSCTELLEISSRFINHHFLDIIHHEEFLNLPEERLLSLLCSNSLLVTSEEQVFEAALLWLEWQVEERVKSACRIMQNLKLALLDTSFLEEEVLRTEFVRNCPRCQNLVADAMRARTMNRLQIDTIQVRGETQGVYVLGGRNSEDCQLRSMEKYDIMKDRWAHMVSSGSTFVVTNPSINSTLTCFLQLLC